MKERTLSVANLEKTFVAQRGYADAYWVPMTMLDEVRNAYASRGIPVRVRFRGPRVQSVGDKMDNNHGVYRRTFTQAAAECLKADATHFSVYRKV